MLFKKCEPTNLEHIGESYSLDWKFGANSIADGYRAYDKFSKRRCSLWITREPLDDAGRLVFYEHARSLRKGGVERISKYGCDVDGIGYVALPILAVKRLDYDMPGAAVKARRLLGAILKVEALHLQGLVCGNLCSDSFMLDSEEQVHFVGYAGGDFERPYRDLPIEYHAFIPPEDLDRIQSSQTADVYALAVNGLKLFGATFPDGSIIASNIPDYLKSLDPNAPLWLQVILPRVLSCSPETRYKDASQLLAAIADQVDRQKDLTAENYDEEGASHDLKEEAEVVFSLPRGLVRQQARVRRLLSSPLFVMSCVGLLLCMVLGASWMVVSLSNASSYAMSENERARLLSLDLPHEKDRPSITASLGQSLSALFGRTSYQPDALPPARVGEAEKTSSAVSPQDTSASRNVDASQPVRGELVPTTPAPGPSDHWQDQLVRARDGGYRLTAEVLEYLVNTPNSIRPADISALLGVVAVDVPKEKRREVVISYEPIDSDLAYMLAGALTLDLSDQVLFRELITRGALKQIGVSRAPVDSVSTVALISAIPSARELLFDHVIKRASSIGDEDVWWLLETLILQRAEHLRDFVRSERINLLGLGYHRFFLQSVAHASDMQSVPIGSLLNSARQQPTMSDVQKYSQWYDPGSVRVLLATLLVSTDPEVLQAAFDALTNKSTGNTSVDEALSYISNKSDVLRVYYANFVGGVGLVDSLNPDEIKSAFSSVKGKPHSSQLCKLMLQRGSLPLIKAILETLGDTINPALLVELLKHPDKSVRLQIIPFVKEVSLSSSRQQVVDAYLTESDPEVKAKYESEMPRIKGS